ncbi:hypothetical protein [Roseomonas genomospecies 6]|uniref:Glycine zipper domain-containing protein n=1 Tax=Roseomonas genomospecies 6 TaxID=214106 RepID=A0A9W7NHF1_9PROT|nr:hypothetical protein [Roseomonas genomospecies 6]KAA0678776.1 hypothetical protein DS843_18660 [Roseomonas genomospecies 6]
MKARFLVLGFALLAAACGVNTEEKAASGALGGAAAGAVIGGPVGAVVGGAAGAGAGTATQKVEEKNGTDGPSTTNRSTGSRSTGSVTQ